MAYAAMVSLKHTLKNGIPQIKKSTIKRALDSLGSMLVRLDASRCRGIERSGIHELDAKIREAVWKLEDVLESSDQGLSEQEINSFLNTLKKLTEEYSRELLQKPLPQEEYVAAVLPIDNGSTTVGLSDQSENIIIELLDETLEFKNVSLVGMAGIGKTHLAKQIYHHPLILQHFELRVWVSIGPIYQGMRKYFVDIAAQIESKPRDLYMGKDEDILRGLIKKLMRGKRFLIVLDDIWGIEIMDYFDVLLTLDENGSRVLVTTRQEQVTGLVANIHQMRFLNNEESWNLLWQNVFVDQDSFPSQLEKLGRKIAELCEGLPLLILAVADILRGLDKTKEYWIKVAEKKTSTFTDAYDNIYEVLLTSYEYLPQHLKACFLYMGAFPQSCKIPSSKFINLCIVEDFHDELSRFKKRERSAMRCLEDLVSRSLAIVCKWSFERVRRTKSSKLHSAYWYLCVKEASKTKFLHVLIKLTDVSIESQRRLAVQNNMLFGIREVYDSMAADTSSTTRSLLFTGEDHQYPVSVCFNMMLLRVLDALAIHFYEFPNEVLKLLQLRYLALTHNGEHPSSISNLQRLQYLILRRRHNIINLIQRDSASCLPKEIWDMQELRHLRIMGSNLPDPSKDAWLPKILTLHVNAHSCTKAVFRSLSNLRKLGITIELQPDAAETIGFCFEHMRFLGELESLKCVVVNPRLRSHVIAPPNHLSNLPRGLTKLSLNGLGYSWKYITEIGSLPNLHVLKLRCSAIQGPEWETKASQFTSLEFLLLEDIDLLQWKLVDVEIRSIEGELISCKCFPRLRNLTVRHCYKLRKLPSEFGEIQFLETIEVDECSPSVMASALRIKEKTKSSRLQLVINSSWNL